MAPRVIFSLIYIASKYPLIEMLFFRISFLTSAPQTPLLTFLNPFLIHIIFRMTYITFQPIITQQPHTQQRIPSRPKFHDTSY